MFLYVACLRQVNWFVLATVVVVVVVVGSFTEGGSRHEARAMDSSQTANYIKDDQRDLEKEMHDLDPRLVNLLLSKIQQNLPAGTGNYPPNGGGRAPHQGIQGPMQYGPGMHHSGGMGINTHVSPQPYNPAVRTLSPYGPQYGHQQQQIYSNHHQGGYHHQSMDHGYQAINAPAPASSSYFNQVPPVSSYGRPQQYMSQQHQEDSFVPYGSNKYKEPARVDPGMNPSFLTLRGHDLIEFSINMVKIDPYISTEACKEILDQKFPELASNKYRVSFGALMSFYKVSQNTQEVPPDIVIMLSTVADAMNQSRGSDVHEIKPVSDDGGSISNHKKANDVMQPVQPKRKRGRPRKHPKVTNSVDTKNAVQYSKSGEKCVHIVCNGKSGLFRLDSQTCDCFCDVCNMLKDRLGLPEIDMSPKEFEKHAGMGHMKKWRTSITINFPALPNMHGKALGTYLSSQKVEPKSTRGVHDQLVRTYAKPLGKGVPSAVDNVILAEAAREKVYPYRSPVNFVSETSEDEVTRTRVPEEDSNLKIKRKVGRPRKNVISKPEKEQAIERAQKAKQEPVISAWRILENTLNMTLSISYGNARFSGVLEFVGVSNNIQGAEQKNDTKKDTPTGDEQKVVTREDSTSPNRDTNATRSMSSPKSPSKRKSDKMDAYQSLYVQGPPPGSTCGLCGGPNEDEIHASKKGFFGRMERGLGKLTLIKVNNASNSWVHEQCARWSPEVHDPTGEGILVGVKDAIIRGRRLKCKLCGEKGATLGCFSKRCKSSFHLPCARKVCILKGNPYFVCCQDHRSEFFPDDESPNRNNSKA